MFELLFNALAVRRIKKSKFVGLAPERQHSEGLMRLAGVHRGLGSML